MTTFMVRFLGLTNHSRLFQIVLHCQPSLSKNFLIERLSMTHRKTLAVIASEERVNYHTLRRWLLKSKVKCQRVGTTYLVRACDVKKIVKAGGKC
jgi:hypothetical protein